MVHSSRVSRRWAIFALQGAIVGLFLWHAYLVQYAGEDSYISFRYVRNFVEGHGLVYNVGERVEGYTNFLWVILLAAVSRLVPSVDLPALARAGGVCAAVLTIIVAFRFSVTTTRRYETGLLAGFLLAVHSGFVAWSTAGLETMLFTLLVCLGAFACARCLEGDSGAALWTPFWFGLAALARADGVLFFAATLAIVLVVEVVRHGGHGFRKALRLAAVFAAIYLPYLLWRYAYYADLFPNTAYAKAGGGLEHVRSGIRYVRSYVADYGVWVWIPAVALYVWRRGELWVWYFIGLIAAHLSYVMWLGGDSLGFHRFIVPIAPLMYVVAADALTDGYDRYVRPFVSRPIRLVGASLVVVSIAWCTARSTIVPVFAPERARWLESQSELWFPGDGGVHSYRWFGNYFVDRLRIAARYLDHNAPANSLVASTPAGAIAYYMHHRVIDMLGLTDKHIARTAVIYGGDDRRIGHEKGDGRYVLSRSPDYILLGNVAVLPFPLNETSMPDKLVLKSEHDLWADPEFHARYELVSVRLAASGPFQYFTFYRKKKRS